MMKLNQWLAMTGMAVVMCMSASELMAQDQGGGRQRGGQRGGGGNFDPAQFQQRMMERYREILEVKDDAEWKVIQPLVQKVMDARMAVGTGGRGGMFGRGGRGGGNPGDTAAPPRPSFGPANPEADALQKAIDSKASNAETKTALAKYAEARKVKQADLEKAQADLRKVLSVRQEAIATMSGLL